MHILLGKLARRGGGRVGVPRHELMMASESGADGGSRAATPRGRRAVRRMRRVMPQRTFGMRLLVSGIVLSLAGCGLGPFYEHPDTAAPAAWHTPPESSRIAWPSTEWWTGFRAPELNALIAQAEAANFDLAAAVARVREADAQARIAGAPLLPSVGATAGISRQKSQPVATNTGVIKDPAYTASSASLDASYEIDFWGKNRATLEAAEALAQGSRYDRDTVALTVVTSVATTYFQILALRDRIAVAEDNLKTANTVLDMLNTELSVGTATALDVAQQQTTVATLAAEIPPLRQQEQQNVDALAILLGKPPEALQIGPGKLTDIVQPTVAPGLPSALLARRPDIASAEAQLISANANIRVARAAYFPSVSLTAQGGIANAALATAFGATGPFYALAAGVTQPIFEGGALEGQLAFSKARYDELLQDYRKAVISAFADVEDALVAAQQTSIQLQRQQDAVAKAQTAYDISFAQLRAGTVNLLTVIDTENALFPAQDALVQAELARLQAIVSLFKALGGGWRQT